MCSLLPVGQERTRQSQQYCFAYRTRNLIHVLPRDKYQLCAAGGGKLEPLAGTRGRPRSHCRSEKLGVASAEPVGPLCA